MKLQKGIIGLAAVAVLGAAALPIAAYADTATVEVKLDVNSALTIANTGSAEVALGTSTSDVNPGDELEYLLAYKNTGSVIQENVVVSSQLPDNMIYVAGSTKLNNGKGSNQVMPDAVTTNGLNIGTYAPNAVAYTWFEVKVAAVSIARVSTQNGIAADTAYTV
jgi:uncharacterized repeat protein (TIGR01451 family)